MTNPVSLLSFYCLLNIPLIFYFLHHFFTSHTFGPTDLPPSPAPQFEAYKVLVEKRYKLRKAKRPANRNFVTVELGEYKDTTQYTRFLFICVRIYRQR